METILIGLGFTGGFFLLFHTSFLLRRKGPVGRDDPSYWALSLTYSAGLGFMLAELIAMPAIRFATWQLPGWGLAILARLWTHWSYRHLGDNYTPEADNSNPSQILVRSGPYRWFRHPIYLGNALTLIGFFWGAGVRWTWLALVPYTVVVVWRVRREEHFLKQKFGKPI